jgi:NAD(P)-dependent dehydrogenase (short-subunit alcohol dehydrogenase family)
MSARVQSAARVAWVTGAGKGIGRAVCLRLARDGWIVAASARTRTDLEDLASAASGLAGRIEPFVLDVTDAKATVRILAAIENGVGLPDWVLLNAGTHRPVDGAAFDAAVLRELVETNLMGTANCLAPAIARFVARGSGRIGVVASIAGYRGLPTASAYGATKAALINMCESLRPELATRGVCLSVINPGFVRTPLTDRNTFPMPFLMAPEAAADRIVRGMTGTRFEIAFPSRFMLIMKLVGALPDALYFAITRRMVREDR